MYKSGFLLTAAKLEGAGVCIHGEILQLHGAFCRYGQPDAKHTYNVCVT